MPSPSDKVPRVPTDIPKGIREAAFRRAAQTRAPVTIWWRPTVAYNVEYKTRMPSKWHLVGRVEPVLIRGVLDELRAYFPEVVF